MTNLHFNEQQLIHELKHYLPTQTPLKDFIHHNSLHAFQDQKFFDAIFKASQIFGFQATLQLEEFRELFKIGRIKPEILNKIITDNKGASQLKSWQEKLFFSSYDQTISPRIGKLRTNWKNKYHINLDDLVHPLLFRVLGSYLDQGISLWEFPKTDLGFLDSIRQMEQNSFVSFFNSSRVKKLALDSQIGIQQLLSILVGNETYYSQYVFDQQFSHRGWSGMVATIQENPDLLLSKRSISLQDLIHFELLLEIDNLDSSQGKHWKPLCLNRTDAAVDLFENSAFSEFIEVLQIWQIAFEWSYYDEVLSALTQNISKTNSNNQTSPNKLTTSFQAFFCIDERECSLRRHLEHTDKLCETFGTPGFFGVEFYYQPQGAKFYDKLCPAPVTPNYLIKEQNVSEPRHHELLYTSATNRTFSGYICTLTLGFVSGLRLFQNLFKPKMSPAISNAFGHMSSKGSLRIENLQTDERENGLQIGFTPEEMASRVAALLNSIGLVKHFAPLVYIVAHGSSSANNPHHGAHDCGACSGRPGSVNARVFAFMANHPKVRLLLSQKGIDIPVSTQFVGALHDTAADEIAYYDLEVLSPENKSSHVLNCLAFEKALDLNAKERSRRFASINTKAKISKVRKAIKQRSVSLFEPRPELGHGTNTLCVVGRRQLTKDLFLDRRAFLNSYNYEHDPQGVFLSQVMKPLGPVCGGINLEYYFSRVDNHKLGAGTKLPHNVMALIGVTNSVDGDLRPGLPWQMVEVHDPLRLLIIVEHFPEVVLKTIQDVPEMYQWFINEWVHLIAVNPKSNNLFYFKNGQFIPYNPSYHNTKTINHTEKLFEDALEMESNSIVHATLENLPVFFNEP